MSTFFHFYDSNHYLIPEFENIIINPFSIVTTSYPVPESVFFSQRNGAISQSPLFIVGFCCFYVFFFMDECDHLFWSQISLEVFFLAIILLLYYNMCYVNHIVTMAAYHTIQCILYHSNGSVLKLTLFIVIFVVFIFFSSRMGATTHFDWIFHWK